MRVGDVHLISPCPAQRKVPIMDFTPYMTSGFAIAALAGFAGSYNRGFTSFGSNLIWAPGLVTVMEPVQAVAIMGLVGMIETVQITIPIVKVADWKGI